MTRNYILENNNDKIRIKTWGRAPTLNLHGKMLSSNGTKAQRPATAHVPNKRYTTTNIKTNRTLNYAYD